MSIAVETQALIQALDRLGAKAEAYTRAAAFRTAENVRLEMQRRVARRTGRTAQSIIRTEDRGRKGYVVFVENPDVPNIDLYLEFGTKHMSKRPFFFAAARLEEGAHDRRMREAIQQAITETGLGG